MPVDFLSDGEAARYGRFCGPPSRAELEKVFFLDDADRRLVKRCRGPHNRLGYAVQLTTVRYVGRFLTDPLDGVPTEVIDSLAEQLGIQDASCLKKYAQREGTHREHAGQIQKIFGLKDFADCEGEFVASLAAHAWNSGDGPTALFQWSVHWLRENDALLPGVTTLTRLVARERDAATQRLYDTLAAGPTDEQVVGMENLLEVPPGKKVSEWERWRTGPSKASGPGLVKALSLVEEILASGLGRLELDPSVPQRRLVDLAKYGLGARSAQMKRHPSERRIATLVASVRRLETKTIDDALELLDLLMVTELLGKAQREADKQKVRRHPKLAKASARLALAVEVLLEAAEIGDEVALFEVWEMIEARIPRRELRDAVETVHELVPPPDTDDDGGWWAEMASRYATVSGL
ncbi:DUF4158 domain-containing protein [Streptosporangium sp. NPDC000396]|uniref:DUF4158 domain-containing protein n=1 Tax=Streptosporangium sp. NPDC000396 TaxID=3366185 RepID=UPI00367E5659